MILQNWPNKIFNLNHDFAMLLPLHFAQCPTQHLQNLHSQFSLVLDSKSYKEWVLVKEDGVELLFQDRKRA